MTDGRNRIKLVVVLAAVGFLSLVGFIIYQWLHVSYDEMVVVANLDECAVGIERTMKESVFTTIYQYVKAQNEVGDKVTDKTYEAVIRDGTCATEDFKNEKDKLVSTGVKAILDIDELQYSYLMRFSYIKPGSDRNEYVDLGTTMLTCLREKEMIYQDFGCNQNQLIKDTSLDVTYWEIFSALPYVGDGFTLTYTLSPESISGYSIVFKYNVPESAFKNGTYGEFIAERRKMAENYLRERGVDLDDYSLIESKRYW